MEGDECLYRSSQRFAPAGSVVLDPFAGSGTTCLVAQSLDYDFIGFDIEQKYVDLTNDRLKNDMRYFRGVGTVERSQRIDRHRTTGTFAPVTFPKSKKR